MISHGKRDGLEQDDLFKRGTSIGKDW